MSRHTHEFAINDHRLEIRATPPHNGNHTFVFVLEEGDHDRLREALRDYDLRRDALGRNLEDPAYKMVEPPPDFDASSKWLLPVPPDPEIQHLRDRLERAEAQVDRLLDNLLEIP